MKNQLDLPGIKKRIKGKLVVMQRKRNRKMASRSKSGSATVSSEKETKAKGRNVDYYKYLLLFKVKDDPKQLDSLVVEHTSQYKTLIELDLVRLEYKIDTILPKNILMVYIKKYYPDTSTQENAYIAKGRVRAIRKRLHHAGIPLSRIKVLQDSLSPPRL